MLLHQVMHAAVTQCPAAEMMSVSVWEAPGGWDWQKKYGVIDGQVSADAGQGCWWKTPVDWQMA